MMDHVQSPEQAAFVAGAMEHIISKVFRKKQNGPGPPLISDIEDGEAMNGGISRKDQRLADHAQQHAAGAHDQAGGSVLELIEIAAHDRVKHHLKQQKCDKARDGQVDEIGYLRHAKSALLLVSSLTESESRRKLSQM